MLNRHGSRWAAGTLIAVTMLATGYTGGSHRSTGASKPGTGGAGNFCALATEQSKGLTKAFPTDYNNADQVKAYGAYLLASNARVLAAAPADIRGDIESVTRVTDALGHAVQKAGKLATPPDVRALRRSPAYQAALLNVTRDERDRCRLGASPSPTG